ncbi:hypothetical protein GRX03_01590 [Halovenus sp. WSH3]|uniref:Uncharacterized protein n=1 Tax=Halovenus carboxidivorans TaxID=2692199 RepID=A0A6B0T483_9EURY|nr:hypothetical protein [Halovenus carboxidivorans]MXR50303.1 hypothetical protein [Halovenus carboxidivorans]
MDTSSLEDKRKFGALVVVVGAVLAIITAAILGANVEEAALAAEVGLYSTLIVGGTYALGRRFGQPHSHAVASAGIAFGALYLIAVSFRLMTEFGVRETNQVIMGMGAAIGLGVVTMAVIAALGRLGPSPS